MSYWKSNFRLKTIARVLDYLQKHSHYPTPGGALRSSAFFLVPCIGCAMTAQIKLGSLPKEDIS
jgi:hypothetical protein